MMFAPLSSVVVAVSPLAPFFFFDNVLFFCCLPLSSVAISVLQPLTSTGLPAVVMAAMLTAEYQRCLVVLGV